MTKLGMKYSICKLCIQNNLPNVKISAFFNIQIQDLNIEYKQWKVDTPLFETK